jgi:hypothetical protein
MRYLYQRPDTLTFPSSIFPALSGIPNYPSGYKTVLDKQLLMSQGSGLFTGNMADFGQERDFNQSAEWITGPNGENILGTQLAGFTGKGINRKYVSPESYQFGNDANGRLYGMSGIFVTYPPKRNELGTGSAVIAGQNYTTSTGPADHPEYTGYIGSKGSGVFNFKKFLSTFSNAEATKLATGAAGIDDFTIFNDYIHYLPFSSASSSTGGGGAGPAPVSVDDAVRVPFVADLVPTTSQWDRYGTGEVDDEYLQHSTDPDYSSGAHEEAE